jgi:hypothetical protein
VPHDSIFDYLRHCGGQDFLCFPSARAAAEARLVLINQLTQDGVDMGDMPSIDQFDTQLRLRSKEAPRDAQPSAKAAAVR